MAKILWVEDHFHWVEKLKPILEKGEFDSEKNEITIFKFPEAARQFITAASAEQQPDVALLDARMNGNDEAGFCVATALHKKWPKLPIIYLSEHSGTPIERSALEQHNATDFIAKHQHNVEEVVCWRIKAVLRQQHVTTPQQNSSTDDVLCSGDFKLDLNTWEAYWQGEKLMNPDNPKRPLAPTPRRILRCLVERSPRPVSADQIAEQLDMEVDRFSYASYRQHIKTLRRSFDAAQGDKQFSQQCKQGVGIIAFGQDGAYCWKPAATEELQ